MVAGRRNRRFFCFSNFYEPCNHPNSYAVIILGLRIVRPSVTVSLLPGYDLVRRQRRSILSDAHAAPRLLHSDLPFYYELGARFATSDTWYSPIPAMATKGLRPVAAETMPSSSAMGQTLMRRSSLGRMAASTARPAAGACPRREERSSSSHVPVTPGPRRYFTDSRMVPTAVSLPVPSPSISQGICMAPRDGVRVVARSAVAPASPYERWATEWHRMDSIYLWLMRMVPARSDIRLCSDQ